MKQGLKDLFSGIGAKISIDPESIGLVSDRVLIRDLQEFDERIGSIYIPETADGMKGVGKSGSFRTGAVVSCGPGDKFIEVSAPGNGGSYAWGDTVRRRLLTSKDGSPLVVPPQVAPGDRVIFETRKHERVYFEGIPYYLMHAEQAVVARIRDNQTLQPLYSWVLVKPMDKPYKGILVIPTVSSDNELWAKVLAVGPGTKIDENGGRYPVDLHARDVIVFPREAPYPLRWNNEQLALVRESQVWMTVEVDGK